ncbi:MAG: PH domain-containing protein [Bacteroidaceae bacterium]|nr:PH domain-containing protein [Bacteroidaceae bacterium]
MNRIFHARIAGYQNLLIVILGIATFYSLWVKSILATVLLMLILVVVIEKAIHTTYTFTTEDTIKLYNGRFMNKKIVPIKDITAIREYHSMKIGNFSMTHYYVIEYGKRKFVSVIPVKKHEFFDYLNKKLTELEINNHS